VYAQSTLKLTSGGYNPALCPLNFLPSRPSSLQIYIVANEQGCVGRDSVNNIDRIGDSRINSAFFGVGA
jgi:hypothetical protein